MRQLAHGRTNREIADALFVSEETVKNHIGNIFGKLQLTHRTQALIYALKHKLISLDELDLYEIPDGKLPPWQERVLADRSRQA